MTYEYWLRFFEIKAEYYLNNKNVHEGQPSKTRKRENAKRENGFRVFNFIFKFQKREFKNCYFMKFMK